MWEHIDSIKWLIDGERGTGRSTAMALVFIEKAVESNCRVSIYDHVYDHGRTNVEHMCNTIKVLSRKLDILKELKIIQNKRCIQYNETKRVIALRKAGVLYVAKQILGEVK